MGKSSGSQTQKVEPWKGAQQYLLGTQGSAGAAAPAAGGGGNPLAGMTHDQIAGMTGSEYQALLQKQQQGQPQQATGGIPGVFPEAARLYGQGGWNGSMQDILGNLQNLAGGRQQQLADRAGSGLSEQILGQGQAMLAGAYDPKINSVGAIQSGGPVTADQVRAQQVDPTAARASQGVLDPTNSLSQLLSGQVNNPYLDQQIAAIGQDLSQNLNNNVMPGIRSGAIGAGGYGGSRQGIAEGLAAQGVTQQVANQAAQLRGNAFESAQQRMYGTANALDERALSNSTNNANRSLQADLANQQANMQAGMFNSNMGQRTNEFNANLGLQNNNQTMQAQQQNVANRNNALQFLNGGLGLQDNTFNQQFGLGQSQLGLSQMPNQYNWQNLNNYASIIQPGAGLGSSATTSGQGGSNPIAGGLGGALAGSQLGTALGMTGPWGAVAGGILGLLG